MNLLTDDFNHAILIDLEELVLIGQISYDCETNGWFRKPTSVTWYQIHFFLKNCPTIKWLYDNADDRREAYRKLCEQLKIEEAVNMKKDIRHECATALAGYQLAERILPCLRRGIPISVDFNEIASFKIDFFRCVMLTILGDSELKKIGRLHPLFKYTNLDKKGCKLLDQVREEYWDYFNDRSLTPPDYEHMLRPGSNPLSDAKPYHKPPPPPSIDPLKII